MHIVRTVDRVAFIASDGCELCELLHSKDDRIDLPYSLAEGRVEAGGCTHRHRLAQAEVYVIRAGGGIMHVENDRGTVVAGDVIHVPAGAAQWLENPGINPLTFLCIVSPPWRAEDDVRLE